MMKYAAILLVALLGVANASLRDDFDDLMALIPVDEIKALTKEYAENDEQFQIAVTYIKGDEFRAILTAIHDTPEWQTCVDYLGGKGLDIVGVIESFYSLLDTSSYTVRSSARPSSRSFHDWLDAVIALIPWTEIRALIAEKKENSAEFQEFLSHMSGEEVQAVVAAVAATEEWQNLLTKGRDHGVPVDTWITMICSIFGWEF